MKEYNYIKNELFIEKSTIIKIILFITMIFCILKKALIYSEPILEGIMYRDS